ncbi:TolB family protein [Polluticaenibacter yanchengensis]|uniref:TolB protein n=1 Tax=Polluticaenibacter yanchengensis TaxID=3014562 RepID=A0ABT4URL8_9BACT|nr:hypothetical protein [Chitinophagaceae bacterium LY-5]
MRKLLVLALLQTAILSIGKAQNFGGNRPATKWQILKSPNARVIFPKGLDSLAKIATGIIDSTSSLYRQQIGNTNKVFNIVLQPNNTISNGYVGLGPSRSEFYTTAPFQSFELSAIPWLNALTLHEYRHIVQYSNLNVGLSKFGRALFGDYGQDLLNSMAIPNWFFEGDAVWAETKFSEQGRGSLAYFDMGYKSLKLAGKNYSFQKLRNGSYKDYVPNHYQLGYILTAYGYNKYGNQAWEKVIKEAAAYKGVLYPFQKAVKRNFGIGYKTFYTNALNEFNSKVQPQNNETFITAATKEVVHYKYPNPTGRNTIIAYKSGYNLVPSIVEIDQYGIEKRIATFDISLNDYFSYKNDLIVYTAYRPDTRWTNESYSPVRVLNVLTGKTETVGPLKARYFAPDISVDGSIIVTVELLGNGNNRLVVLDKNSGREIYTSAWSVSERYQFPKFINNSRVLFAVANKEGEMAWKQWTPGTNEMNALSEFKQQIIGYPVIQNDQLLYTSSTNSNDAIVKLDLMKKGKPVIVGQNNVGLYQGYLQGDSVISTTFTAGGFKLVKLPVLDIPLNDDARQIKETLFPIQKQPVEVAGAKAYTIEKYSKWHKPFNFHSLQVEADDPVYGLSLLGENVLNTLQSEIYCRFNNNDFSSTLGISEMYGGTYLMPYLTGSYTWDRNTVLNKDTTLYFNVSNIGAGFQLPLNFSYGKSYKNLTINTSVNNQQVLPKGVSEKFIRSRNNSYLNVGVRYSQYSQQARMHINPRFGFAVNTQLNTLLSSSKANQFNASGNLYLPGLFPSHSLVLQSSVQLRDTVEQVVFANAFGLARGYKNINTNRMYKVGVNYHLPVLYPDWGFGHIAYINRVRTNFFFDYNWLHNTRRFVKANIASVGNETFIEGNLWNQLDINIGFRYSRLLKEIAGNANPNYFEIILPVGLLRR